MISRLQLCTAYSTHAGLVPCRYSIAGDMSWLSWCLPSDFHVMWLLVSALSAAYDRLSNFVVTIHECFQGSSVQYYLAFLMNDDTKLSLSFRHLYPEFNSI